MWLSSILLLFVTFNGIMAQTEMFEQCMGMIENVKLNVKQYMKSEELEAICPDVLNYLNCFEDVIKNITGFDVADLAAMFPGTAIGNGAALLVNIKNVSQDLCSNDSDLYKEYEKDAECLDTIAQDELVFCEEKAKLEYESFKGQNHNLEEEDQLCMEKAYQVACIGAEVFEKCGQRAFDTYIEMLNRLGIFRLSICADNEQRERKTSFLESLELDTPRRELFRSTFDL